MIRVLTIARTVWLEMIRRKDIYVLLILLVSLLFVLMSLNVFGLNGLVRYVMDTGLLMTWVFGWILAVNISTRQLPREESSGTVFPLLAKPVARGELVAGKWLGAWSIASAALLVFYAIILLLVRLRGGTFNPATVLQAYALHAGALALVSAIGVLLSTRMNYDAAASMTYVLTLGAFLVVPRVPHFALNERGLTRSGLLALYYLLPHFELFDCRRRLVHAWGPARWSSVAIILVYASVLVALCLTLGWLAYRRKRFARGTVG
ncbi:MAG: ABC transporter permease subunit [Kiritimatiellae bacterium]|nr:ABC transporter permease subunit [Kiritimatiellia bacterium]